MSATNRGHSDCIEEILKHGANIEARNKFGDTILITASTNGHLEKLMILLKYKANIEARGNLDRTSLHGASLNGHTECVLKLLKHGANIEATDKESNGGGNRRQRESDGGRETDRYSVTGK